MINEKDFIEILETFTNKKLGEDFGFVLGTFTPFENQKGFISGSNKEGFILWVKNNNIANELHITDNTLSLAKKLKLFVDFLNN